MLCGHVLFQPHHLIHTVERAGVDGVAAHIGLECLVVAGYHIGALLLGIGLREAVLGEHDVAQHVPPGAAALLCPELGGQLAVGHVHLLFLIGVDRPVQGQADQLALLIADDADLFLKGIEGFDVPSNHGLHSLQGRSDLGGASQLPRLHQNHIDGPGQRTLRKLRLKRNLLETNAVAEVEALFSGVAFHHLNHIRHGHGSARIASRVVKVKFGVDGLQIFRFHLAVKDKIVEGGVDAFPVQSCEGVFIAHHGNTVFIPFHVDLINLDFHSRSTFSFL